MKNILTRQLCRVLIVCMGALSFSAYADMVGTDQVAAAARAAGARETLRGFIERGEVRDQLQHFGIGRASARNRVDAMTDAEVASIAGRIERLPAGGISTAAALVSLIVVELIWYYWVK
ncbi:MAG: PA2779 family protein [Burkholderiales bacterium]|nr:PA2779 family protein [Burkholderiales bacterium]